MKVICNSPKSGKHYPGSSQPRSNVSCGQLCLTARTKKAELAASCYNKWCEFCHPGWITWRFVLVLVCLWGTLY